MVLSSGVHLSRELKVNWEIGPSEMIISIISNSAADWSFGNGTARFLTGDL